MKLRDYQQDALDAILGSLNKQGNDLVVLPTGAGKSWVIAALAKSLNLKVLVFQPSVELVIQNHEKLSRYTDDLGIYCSSLGQKVHDKQTIFATIGSVRKVAHLFQDVDLVIIDEGHLLDPKTAKSQYTKFVKEIGSPKTIGLTATPFRNFQAYNPKVGQSGLTVYEPTTQLKLINRVRPAFWSRIVYHCNIADLTNAGHLMPITYTNKSLVRKELKTNAGGSDYDLDDYWDQITTPDLIVETVKDRLKVHKSILVFCPNIKSAEYLSSLIPGSKVLTGKTPNKERAQMVKDFKSGVLKVLLNVLVLGTGFDFPELSCILYLRPTKSLLLYYQVAGRLTRIAKGKTIAEFIDFTNTVKDLGRLETIRLVKAAQWEILTETGSWHGKDLYTKTGRDGWRE